MSSFQTQYQLSRALLKNKNNRYSRPIVHLAVAGVVLSLVIMIIAVSVTTGYKNQIRQKVIAMGSHIRISNNDFNYSYEPVPFDRQQPRAAAVFSGPDAGRLLRREGGDELVEAGGIRERRAFGELRLAYWHDGETVTPVSGGSVSGSMFDFVKDMRMSKDQAQYDNMRIPALTLLKNVTVTGAESGED